MRKAEVYNNGILAGLLIEDNQHHYSFQYNERYLADPTLPAISIQLSKSNPMYQSKFLFPVFSNMVAEGANLAIQSRYLKIDEKDVLGLLIATAGSDSIGSITIKPIEEK